MKTNKMMRVASALLVAVLLTTCAISGTFAKYTSSATATDSARVAYWGWQATGLTLDLFDGSYTNVAGTSGANVIAPGTSKTTTFGFGYDTNGSVTVPEVAYSFTVDATATGDYDSLDANNNFKWTFKASGSETTNQYNTVAELIAAIKALSGEADGSKDYGAGELPTAFTSADQTYEIGWVWNFSSDAAGDSADTAMGNATELENISITITITATQID